MRRALDIRGAAFAVRDSPRTFETGIGDVGVEGVRQNVSWLGIAHEVECQIDHVQKIDGRAAAGHGFGGEPTAEARNAGAADPFRLRGIDGPDRSVIDVFFHRLRFRASAVVEIEHQLLACLVRDFDHLRHFRGVQSGRLFTKYVLTCFKALDGEWSVKLVRNDDADRIEFRSFLQHLVHGIEGFGDVPLLGRVLRCARQGIRDRHDFRTCRAKAFGMVFHHPSGTDNSYFD